MKHIITVLLFMLLCLGLSAQTGWFNISFDQAREAALDILTEQGFETVEDTDAWMAFTNSGLRGLIRLVVYCDGGATVSSWSAIYDATSSEDFNDELYETLVEMYGDDPVWDEYYEAWAWELENDKGVYFYELADDTIKIEFTEFDYSVYDYWY